MPAETEESPPEPVEAIPWKAEMMPTTVPRSPTNGATEPTDASTDMPLRMSSPVSSSTRSTCRRARSTGDRPPASRSRRPSCHEESAAFVILACAEHFAEALVATGSSYGVSEFLLVQWLAPLASEAPELLVAGMFAWRLSTTSGLSTLVSSKVNQWTLLVGTLPIVFSIASATTHGLPLNSVQREELWVTSKLWNDMHAPERVAPAFERSLRALGLDHLDAYLVHWPFPNHHAPGVTVESRDDQAKPYLHDAYMATWGELEKLVERGLVRFIGTSNMTIPKLRLVLRDARIRPALNQMELL